MADVERDITAPLGRGVVPGSAGLSPWLGAVGLLATAWASLILLYYPTAASIVAIWHRSETFAHGYLIVPISLWLVWEKRAGLRHLRPSPVALPVLLLLPLGALWWLSAVVDVLVVQQFALVLMLMVTTWAVLGHRTARYLAFPILFLIFAVPVGEGLIYPMMNFTADFTVGMLKLTGIPVYREGTFFTIPSGRWSVVEACSGVRYLIASVTLGALFAYLTYTRWWKRALFVLVSIVVPIMANGVRAYLIVMIGHLSDMKLAVGVDHLIYGWVFFGIIVTIMFVVGSFWRDPPRPLPLPEPADGAGANGGRRWPLVISMIFVVSAIWPVLAWTMADGDDGADAVDVRAPAGRENWVLSQESFWDWRPRIVGADGSIYAFYAGSSRPIGLYLGIYRNQRQGAELVSSANMMVPQKHPVWSDSETVPRQVIIGDHRFSVSQHSLSSRGGQRLRVWTWYRVADRHTANPYLAKIIEAFSRFGNGGQGALIAVAAPYDERPDVADDALHRFLEAMLPAIDEEIDGAVMREAPSGS